MKMFAVAGEEHAVVRERGGSDQRVSASESMRQAKLVNQETRASTDFLGNREHFKIAADFFPDRQFALIATSLREFHVGNVGESVGAIPMERSAQDGGTRYIDKDIGIDQAHNNYR